MSNETSTEQTNPAIKHGQGVLQRVEQRKKELNGRLTKIKNEGEHSGATSIEEALAAVAGLLTGDLDAIREPTATQLNQWLETSQHLCDDKATSDAKVDATAAEVKAAEVTAAEVKAAAEQAT